jgi:endoglucanase
MWIGAASNRCIALALGSALALPASAEPPILHRGLNVDLWLEWRTIDEMLSDPAFLETYPDWRRVITSDMFAILAEEGFDFVRLPMDPGPLLAYGPGPAQDALIADMRDGAETALGAGLKVIVDMHPIPRGDDTGGMESIMAQHWPDYVGLVGRVAKALDGLPPDRVVFEPLNEPTNDCEAVFSGTPAAWPGMLVKLHAAARNGAPDLAIILTGACWSQAAALAALDPALIADENVIWTFHSYSPFAYTHQGASWTVHPMVYLWDLPYPPSLMTTEIAEQVTAEATQRMAAAEGTAADPEPILTKIMEYMDTPDRAVADDIAVAAEWADANGIPRGRVLLGEFGALHTVNGLSQPREWYHAFLSDKRRAAEDAGMGWAVLGYAGGMGVAIDGDPDRRLSPGTCQALGLVPCAQ